jgi:hypothetical protein
VKICGSGWGHVHEVTPIPIGCGDEELRGGARHNALHSALIHRLNAVDKYGEGRYIFALYIVLMVSTSALRLCCCAPIRDSQG